MGKKKGRRKTVRLEYHHPQLQPADFLHFIELDEFSDDWESLQLDDEDLLALQVLIILGPERAAVASVRCDGTPARAERCGSALPGSRSTTR